jgi:cytochrome c biogenesis protein CcmG/thiol:disulfide interchange protein DsbE
MVPRDELVEHHNRSKLRRLAPAVVVAIGLIAVLVYGLVRPAPEGTKPQRPEFDLPLLSGDETLSNTDLEGRIVVLNFWASWCDPCREEMPMIQRVARQYAGRNVAFVGVDVRDTPDSAREFVREYGITYPIVRDEEEVLAKQLDVTRLPHTFFLDRAGAVKGEPILGELTRAQLVARLDEMLEEPV